MTAQDVINVLTILKADNSVSFSKIQRTLGMNVSQLESLVTGLTAMGDLLPVDYHMPMLVLYPGCYDKRELPLLALGHYIRTGRQRQHSLHQQGNQRKQRRKRLHKEYFSAGCYGTENPGNQHAAQEKEGNRDAACTQP